MRAGSDLHLPEESLGNLEEIAQGSQGVVYRTHSLKMNKESSVYKRYKERVLREVRVPALESMVEYLFSMQDTDGHRILNSAAWPVRTIRKNAVTVGFVMPEIPAGYYFDWRLPSGKNSTQIAQFQYLLNSDRVLARAGHDVSDATRLALLSSVAGDLDFLHSRDIAVGDLSPKNLLFRLRPEPDTYFVDCDAMTLRGVSVLPQLETPDWQVRMAFPDEPIGTAQTDLYKFGLLVLRMFARHQSTSSPEDLPEWCRRHLVGNLRASLGPNPLHRPDAATWKASLDDLGSHVASGLIVPSPAPSLDQVANGVPSRVRAPHRAGHQAIPRPRGMATSTSRAPLRSVQAVQAQAKSPTSARTQTSPTSSRRPAVVGPAQPTRRSTVGAGYRKLIVKKCLALLLVGLAYAVMAGTGLVNDSSAVHNGGLIEFICGLAACGGIFWFLFDWER